MLPLCQGLLPAAAACLLAAQRAWLLPHAGADLRFRKGIFFTLFQEEFSPQGARLHVDETSDVGNLEALKAAFWCHLADEGVKSLCVCMSGASLGSWQRYVVNIGPFHISGGALTPLAWSHEVTTPKPRISRVSNDTQLLDLEFALLVDDSQNLNQMQTIIVFQQQASLCCRQRFATLGLLFATAAAVGSRPILCRAQWFG